MNSNEQIGTKPRSPAVERVGLTMAEFAVSAGIGRTTLYMLPKEIQPEAVRVGKRRVLIEPVRDWLRRYSKWHDSQSVVAA